MNKLTNYYIMYLYNMIKGKSIRNDDLQKLLKASYKSKTNTGDFKIDPSISSKTSKVFKNPATGQVVVAHRGTSGISDWANNAVYALGGKKAYKMTSRYKEAEKVQKEAQKKYGNENISTIGHSQGGLQAELLSKHGNETITLNKATMPFENRKHKNQTDISSNLDLISSLNPFQLKNKKEVILKNKGFNPLEHHAIESLKSKPDDYMFGNGLKERRTNKWITHVKQVQNEKGISYKQAMIEAKQTYTK